MENVVVVTSMVNGVVSINLPELNFKTEWPKKGTKRNVDIEKLKQALYQQGVESLFKEGILYIDNMDQKIELGLEEPGTKEPTNMKVIDDKMKERLLKLMPLRDFKEALKQYPIDQIHELVAYAIENEIIDMDKDEVLRQYTSTDVIRAIQLKRSIAEE